MTWTTKHKTHDLSHGERVRCDDVQTNEKKLDKAHSHSGVRVVNVEVSENGHVVTGVRIVQCYHANHGCRHWVSAIVQCYHAIMDVRHWCPHRAVLPRNHGQF